MCRSSRLVRTCPVTFKYTVDLSGAGCHCVAAVYLVPMNQSTGPGTCGGDYYCDANYVRGVGCSEIDIMEANTAVFKTTWHEAGNGNGYPSQLSYTCINPFSPFQVAATFTQSSVSVALTQGTCTQSTSSGGGALTVDLQHMTPVMSYWYKPLRGDMTWFDGACGATSCNKNAVYSDFSIETVAR